MKGSATIELTDVKTGRKQRIEKHNLVTNGVTDALQTNVFGQMLCRDNDYSSAEGVSTPVINYSSKLFYPLYDTAFGGILLFENTLDADIAKYYQNKKLVGCASNDANSTESAIRGSKNLTESLKLTNGYKYVYDFTTSQANGTISSMALTSKWGGRAGFGDTYSADSPFIPILDLAYVHTNTAVDTSISGIAYFENNYKQAVSVRLTADKTIVIKKYNVDIDSLSLFSTFAIGDPISTQTITATSFGTFSSNYNYSAILDGGDGYVYGFENTGSSGYNSSGNASIRWIKISKTDFTFTEGTWTLNDVQTYTFGQVSTYTGSYYNYIITNSMMYNGYLYVFSYDKTKLHKIKLSDQTVTTITLPAASCNATSKYTYSGSSGWCYSGGTQLNVIGGTIFGSNFYLVGDTPYARTTDSQALFKACKPGLTYKNYIIGFTAADYTPSYGGTAHHHSVVSTWLATPYLATIFNLDAPVTKTNTQTMKITYTLTES